MRGKNYRNKHKNPHNDPTAVVVAIDEVWTIEEVSAFLRVPVATLYRWRTHNDGPKAARIGRHLRYARVDVIAWFRAQQEEAA
ncbi:helix-turn-helix transcriptional regulator [Myceligenerans pegani]|uniref:Helix-turn-helix domain-containing protein n=1 Tax=Myceligenerans pegani TaxID=2776917 RepID=A0ABR9MTZ5_9MICO|nr:helix-turn-helix domain-containing protein [Myceligenerans sp. TRM 65318]MBE1874830.1 helix-turn-helix domain-containing protein [Myceligenerans sp. TRM 65318]MBE3017101.1 helix-turn-helix domain-containing protein [Myceligenerans sp. TRM 65318]